MNFKNEIAKLINGQVPSLEITEIENILETPDDIKLSDFFLITNMGSARDILLVIYLPS